MFLFHETNAENIVRSNSKMKKSNHSILYIILYKIIGGELRNLFVKRYLKKSSINKYGRRWERSIGIKKKKEKKSRLFSSNYYYISVSTRRFEICYEFSSIQIDLEEQISLIAFSYACLIRAWTISRFAALRLPAVNLSVLPIDPSKRKKTFNSTRCN